MAGVIDETHDPKLRSWVESANRPGTDFPIQNLPYGIFGTKYDSDPGAGVAIGDFILDLTDIFPATNLNPLMALPVSDRRDLRRHISRILTDPAQKRDLVPMAEAEMLLPAVIGDYTDFYASIDHASNIGRRFRPDNPLLPNYRHLPIAYHGRASSILVSPASFHRPKGQFQPGPVYEPTRELDYEIEIGAFLGPGNLMGDSIPIAKAEQHIFGVCLLNDWSARDIQRWEYQPLGPFLSKSFATSISPWVITMEALEPYRTASPVQDPIPLPYLVPPANTAFDITLEVWLSGVLVSRTSFAGMYWTLAQMIAHHSANGCPLRPGDLIGSGTVSGPEEFNRGCLLERGTGFLRDGDEVILRGWCERPGFARIGLGECRGRVLSAL